MLIAVIAHSRVASEQTSECSWYFVAFTFGGCCTLLGCCIFGGCCIILGSCTGRRAALPPPRQQPGSYAQDCFGPLASPLSSDTTLGLVLTIGLHKTALRLARWWGEREARRSSPEAALALALSPMVPGEDSHDASPTAAAAEAVGSAAPPASASDPWHRVLLECGNYGGQTLGQGRGWTVRGRAARGTAGRAVWPAPGTLFGCHEDLLPHGIVLWRVHRPACLLPAGLQASRHRTGAGGSSWRSGSCAWCWRVCCAAQQWSCWARCWCTLLRQGGDMLLCRQCRADALALPTTLCMLLRLPFRATPAALPGFVPACRQCAWLLPLRWEEACHFGQFLKPVLNLPSARVGALSRRSAHPRPLRCALQGIDSLFSGHPTLLLFVVMVMCPLLMNICQVGGQAALGSARRPRVLPAPCPAVHLPAHPSPPAQACAQTWLPCAQVLVQDLVLKWRSRGSAGAAGNSAASASDGGLAAKEGLELESTVAGGQVSLLAGRPDRSAPLV